MSGRQRTRKAPGRDGESTPPRRRACSGCGRPGCGGRIDSWDHAGLGCQTKGFALDSERQGSQSSQNPTHKIRNRGGKRRQREMASLARLLFLVAGVPHSATPWTVATASSSVHGIPSKNILGGAPCPSSRDRFQAEIQPVLTCIGRLGSLQTLSHQEGPGVTRIVSF